MTSSTSVSRLVSKDDLEKRMEELRAELKAFLLTSQHHQEDIKNSSASTFLEKDSMDEKLVPFVALQQGTPQGLSEFIGAQGGTQKEEEKADNMLQELLFDTKNLPLLKEMLLADGPKANQHGQAQYGPAMKIYTNILAQSSEKAASRGEGILWRLAVAIALEHAVPLPQRNPENKNKKNVDADDRFVNPIRRYLHYEKAYLNGELDPLFDTLTVWELRFVVDGEEPDETLAWGREMLRSYRPDHVLHDDDYVWKYVAMVRSNIRYGSQHVKHDRPDLQQYQNILMNGGVCGRRAFFGRFILRAFGIPTTARPSPGHGALIHWTPPHNNHYWVANLGGGIGCGTTKTIYRKDLDFLATAKARTNRAAYWQVKRAQWYGDVMGERRVYGEHEKGFENVQCWYGISLKVQKAIIEKLPKKKKSPPPQCHRGNNDGERIIACMADKVRAAPVPPDAKKIVVYNEESNAGTIVIPAAAFQNPKKTKDVNVMKSFRGGLQIYLPAFSPQGLTIVRGGTWKMDANGCRSGQRMKSGGYGKYSDWGFRVAISGGDNDGTDDDDDDDGNKRRPKENLTVEVVHKSGVMMEFVHVKPGTFIMGGERNKDGRFECVEVPKHQVQLTKGFYLGKYPVTQAQYQAVTGSNPSKSTKGPNCPVDNIGESDAFDFCGKLVDTIGKDFRLPTEAEWEYACRAGQGDKPWFFGSDPSKLGEYAWYKDNSGGKSHPVGQKKPNPFGLYDMYGQVFERCSDRYDKNYYKTSPSVDPTGSLQGTKSSFEYKVQVPQAGKYSLVADVITANEKQRLKVSVNVKKDASASILELPFTNGLWQEFSSSVTLSLKQGENTLHFWRDNPPQYGIAVKSFTLKPV